MKCPCCNNEMAKGYLSISSTHGFRVEWTKYKHYFLNPDEEDMKITNGFLGKSIPAFICKDCKQVVFSYEK